MHPQGSMQLGPPHCSQTSIIGQAPYAHHGTSFEEGRNPSERAGTDHGMSDLSHTVSTAVVLLLHRLSLP